MDKPNDTNPTRPSHRRLAPLKLAIRTLHHELEHGTDPRVSLDRAHLESLATTLELLVEDLEGESALPRPASANGERRAPQAISRLN